MDLVSKSPCLIRCATALAVLAGLALPQPASAQPSRAQVALDLGQAERSAADLRRGMTPDDVRRLLGKPKRTELKDDGVRSSASQGALRWTYVWSGTSGPGTLHVDFASDSPEQWRVSAWDWSSY